MHEVYFPDSRDIYKVGYKIAEVPVLGPGELRPLTFYTRYGDVFGWSCVALVVLNLSAIYVRIGLRRKSST
jgi:hypothetical protein